MGDFLMRSIRIMLTLLVLQPAAGSFAQGQVLSDPTKPPLDLLAAGALAGDAVPTSALQSILLSKGRKIAVINGQAVPLGGKYGDATLVAISGGEVTLKSEKGMEVMKLYPGLDKRSVGVQRRQAVKGAVK
jgi:MSHA biogenesis protein MshK